MTALQKLAMGLVVAVVDPRFAGFDGVPDVLGWLLVLLGLRDLWARLGGYPMLMLLAGRLGGRGDGAGVAPADRGAGRRRRLEVSRWTFVVLTPATAVVYGGPCRGSPRSALRQGRR